jgi:hypothetical protein
MFPVYLLPMSSVHTGRYAVQTSADLVVWTDVTENAAHVTKNSDSVVWTRPADPESVFVRLLVTHSRLMIGFTACATAVFHADCT